MDTVNFARLRRVLSLVNHNLPARKTVKVYRPDGTLDTPALATLFAEALRLDIGDPLRFASRNCSPSMRSVVREAVRLREALFGNSRKDTPQGPLPDNLDRKCAENCFSHLEMESFLEAACNWIDRHPVEED